MHVDILIPTMLKKPEYLQKCLESVLKLQTAHSIELYIVGNVAQHELHAFRDSFDAYRFKTNSKNKNKCTFHWRALGSNHGFTGAVNAGADLGTSPLIILLNDDTEVTPTWLDALIAKQVETSAAMVASHILLAKTKVVDSLGFTFLWRGKALAIQDVAQVATKSSLKSLQPADHWLRFPEFVTKEDILKQPAQLLFEPFGPDAAAALYTRAVWEELDGMNATFFAYLEDVDFALRARLLGHTCVVATDAVVLHHKHATSTHFSGFKARQDMLNWWRIVLFSYPKLAWIRFAGSILAERARNLSGLLKTQLKTK